MFSDSALLFWSFVTLAATFGVGAYQSEGAKARNLWIITAACVALALGLGFGLPSFAPQYVTSVLRLVWMLYPLITVSVLAAMLPRLRRSAGEYPAPSVDLTPIEDRLGVLESRIENLEKFDRAQPDIGKLERRISALIEPMLAADRLRKLEETKIPPTEAAPARAHESGSKPTAIPPNWQVAVENLPRYLTQVVGDTSGELQKRLEATAARIRGNALYTTLTEEERAAGLTEAEKQQWHVLREQLDDIRNYHAGQVGELRRRVSPDGGAATAKRLLES